jgi:hypothetical protein
MEVAIKKLTAFRLDSNLLDMLKSAAKREHRSLNNFVECLQECEHLVHALDKLLHFLCRTFMLDRVYTVLLKVVYGMSNKLHF